MFNRNRMNERHMLLFVFGFLIGFGASGSGRRDYPSISSSLALLGVVTFLRVLNDNNRDKKKALYLLLGLSIGNTTAKLFVQQHSYESGQLREEAPTPSPR